MSQEELKSQKLKYFAERMTKIIRRNSNLNVTKLQNILTLDQATNRGFEHNI